MKKSHDGDLARAKVLVVEDEPLIALDYTDWLKAAGAVVIGPCARVSEALQMLEDERIDVAVVDFVLADGNSEPLQAALTEKRVPFVVVTAYPRVLVRRADGGEAIHYKPMARDVLCAAIVDALQAHDQPG